VRKPGDGLRHAGAAIRTVGLPFPECETAPQNGAVSHLGMPSPRSSMPAAGSPTATAVFELADRMRRTPGFAIGDADAALRHAGAAAMDRGADTFDRAADAFDCIADPFNRIADSFNRIAGAFDCIADIADRMAHGRDWTAAALGGEVGGSDCSGCAGARDGAPAGAGRGARDQSWLSASSRSQASAWPPSSSRRIGGSAASRRSP
jgi:hypothetical protein